MQGKFSSRESRRKTVLMWQRIRAQERANVAWVRAVSPQPVPGLRQGEWLHRISCPCDDCHGWAVVIIQPDAYGRDQITDVQCSVCPWPVDVWLNIYIRNHPVLPATVAERLIA